MIIVTGATGNIGRPLIDFLCEHGIPVRGVTRNSQTAALPAQIEIIEGDPSRPDTIASALRGVTGLFLNPKTVQSSVRKLLGEMKGREMKGQHTYCSNSGG